LNVRFNTLPSIIICILLLCFLPGCETGPMSEMKTYLSLWEHGNYEKMYDLLSSTSKKNISKQDFVKRHLQIASTIGQKNIRLQPGNPKGHNIPFRMVRSTREFGDLTFQSEAQWVEEGEGWRIQWTPSVLLPGLGENDQVKNEATNENLRGEIRDRNGEPLAINEVTYHVLVYPSRITDNQTRQKLAQLLGLSQTRLNGKLKSNAPSGQVEVGTLDLKDLNERRKISELEAIPGVDVRMESKRVYPQKQVTAHLIGYIHPISSDQLNKLKSKGYEQGDWIGQVGLEQVLEDRLRPRHGKRLLIVDVNGQTKKVLAQRPGQDGENFRLTIDLDSQRQLYHAIQNDKGAAVAINPETGEVLAMVSAPSYDPNMFINGMPSSEWKRINGPTRPVMSRFKYTYAPGSTMKGIVAAIGLETGKVQPNTTFDTSAGKWQKPGWGDFYITRVPNPGGPINLRKGLAWSDNIYFARAGLLIGVHDMNLYLKKFGFEEKIPFPFPIEPSQISASGKINNEVSLANSSYGQAQIEASPFHLAMMYTAFANKGNIMQPVLLMDAKETVQPKVWKAGVIKPQVAEQVRDLLTSVVTDPHGTGRGLAISGVSIAAKTGTAELKKSKDDKNGTENGWLCTITGRPGKQPDLVTTLFVEDVKDRGGSHYLLPMMKSFIQNRYAGGS
jgi:cell division protein FtsI/penicillin-binding protein 2